MTAPALSAKEMLCLTLCANGRSDIEIADHNGVTRHAVRFHFRNIYRKLGARNRAHAVHIAHHSHILP